ncbi:MAG: CbtA family protein [Gammaproteobacteria bacterium]
MTGQQSFRHIALSAIVAGLIAGLLVTLVMMFTTVPLIAKAEVYEKAGETGAPPAAIAHHHEAQAAEHDHGANEWEPEDGFERAFYTGVATTLTAIGYALVLGACFAQMKAVGWKQGLALGLAGFAVFQLAPALGLPPEPPGMPVADLTARQLWWLGTALATALGLGAWFVAYIRKSIIWIVAGAVLLVVPHIIGAPQASEEHALVPHELARDFVIASLFTTAVLWISLGTIEGYLFGKWRQAA